MIEEAGMQDAGDDFAEEFEGDDDFAADESVEPTREPEPKTYESRDPDQPVQELEPYINGEAERIVFTDGRLTTTNPGWHAVLDALVEAGGPIVAGSED